MSDFPDQHQKKVIDHRGRPLVVVAGPGSGKTRTLVERARSMLASDSTLNVIFITFTRTSRRDTKKKLESVLRGDEDTKNQDFPRVSTLHGFAKSIVHKAPSAVGLNKTFTVLVPEIEQELILGEVIEDQALNISIANLRKVIARKKNTGEFVAARGLSLADLLSAVARYDELCGFYNALDIEGLVSAATTILEKDAVVLPPLYFHADEFQDLNESDQRLVQVLIDKGQSEIVVVGDDDQSIYGGRHAKPQGIRDLFGRTGWENVIFKTCHRLAPHILRASQALIKQHHGLRIDKGITIPTDDRRRVETFVCTADGVEVEVVVSTMKKHIEQGGGRVSYKDFMVLCPTRTIANTFAKHLREKFDIPVKDITQRDVPDDLWRILLVLRMATSDDQVAVRQWLKILKLSGGENQNPTGYGSS